ncbi:hypothetical protein A5886_001825 [Enterococcus sp. 8G7_MSG3316]|uniref:Uncharacterized protein n=1 Tax=Candidatus Enterococcus testudinis TaxID=1834191 RepID=A0A242A6S9_9ENTE|nr:hypothetical protein [Enterococcus sp. 8G7_MSG3316]OTN76746.1 hypothetical protein A5886_001825 [Enterococcus sp. 8G7_MSG3316]
MKFKAKPEKPVQSLNELEVPIDSEGYVHGWYVDGFIVGSPVEYTDEYIALEYWCPIYEDTLKQVDD